MKRLLKLLNHNTMLYPTSFWRHTAMLVINMKYVWKFCACVCNSNVFRVFGAMPGSEEASTLEASKTPNRYCSFGLAVFWTVLLRKWILAFYYVLCTFCKKKGLIEWEGSGTPQEAERTVRTVEVSVLS